MFKREDKVRRHEKRLLNMRSVDLDKSSPLDMYYVPRFIKRGNGDVTQDPHKYYSRDFTASRWSAMMDEFRHPDAKHNFVWTNDKYETDTRWPRTGAVCTKCGDIRKISMFIDLNQVNIDRWCVNG